MRIDKVIANLINANGEVESISLSGCNLMVAIGNSAYVYDLRNLKRPLQLKESPVDARIRCISSCVYFKGMSKGYPRYEYGSSVIPYVRSWKE